MRWKARVRGERRGCQCPRKNGGGRRQGVHWKKLVVGDRWRAKGESGWGCVVEVSVRMVTAWGGGEEETVGTVGDGSVAVGGARGALEMLSGHERCGVQVGHEREGGEISVRRGEHDKGVVTPEGAASGTTGVNKSGEVGCEGRVQGLSQQRRRRNKTRRRQVG